MPNGAAPPDFKADTVEADGPNFKIACIYWDDGERTGYTGLLTIMSPNVGFFKLPPEVACHVYCRAVSSLN